MVFFHMPIIIFLPHPKKWLLLFGTKTGQQYAPAYSGNIIPVELAVFDTDGQKGLSVPSSMEQEAFNEAMANIGSGLGTSISFAQSAGQQVAMDVTRGLLQGTSGYLAKKFRTVKVKLKAGYKVMLYAKQQ